MHPDCINAVTKAIGRPLNAGESKEIEGAIRNATRQLAQKDPNWLSKSASEQLREAAQKAAEDLQYGAAKKKQRLALTILAHDRVDNYLNRFDKPFEGLDRLLAFSPDGKSGMQSIESAARAIRNHSMSKIMDVADILQGKFLGLMNDADGTLALVKELHGENSGNATARQAAKTFHETAEALRVRFNSSGGDIGKLEDWSMPRSHSQQKVAQAADKWVEDHMNWADRTRYINEDGTRMNDDELRSFFTEAQRTLATNGLNKINPGQPSGGGMRANRGSESRSIHYKDADTFIEAQQKYGEASMMDLFAGHIDSISRDIALVEALGPNPNHAMKYHLDTAQQRAALKGGAEGELVKQRNKIETLYSEVAGTRPPVVNRSLAHGFDAFRSLNVASKLGFAPLTALSDQATIHITSKFNKLPMVKVFAQELKMLNPLNKSHQRQAQRAGLGIEQLMGSLQRWGADGLGASATMSGRIAKWSQVAANKTMQLSGLEALTRAGRQGFGAVMMDSVGDLTRRFDSLHDLDPADAERFRNAGISDVDWEVWRLAEVEDWRGTGDSMLTANSIYRIPDDTLEGISKRTGSSPQKLRDIAATRLLGNVLDESFMGVVDPSARSRAMMYGDAVRGTMKGELIRSFWQFKGTATEVTLSHFKRGMAQQGHGKALYLGSLLTTSTIMGAMALQFSEIAKGRDPRDMTRGDFWMAAFLKGGSLGIYGDFILSDQTSYGNSFIGVVGGPVAGDIDALYNLTLKNMHQAAAGKDTHLGAEAVRFIKGHTPGMNIWYAKAGLDHLFLHDLQEALSPGYLKRMRERARREYDQEYWWEPGGGMRAPDIGRAFGG